MLLLKNCIKKIRNVKKMTLKELSVNTGISIGYLCHLEKGSRNNPSLRTIERIANGLKVNISDIFY